MHIPRSTPSGGLAGAAATARQVRVVDVRVEQVQPGVMRVSQATTPGWGMTVRTPMELARAVSTAFREAQISCYAAWRNHTYDGDDGSARTVRRSRPVNRGYRSDVHDPREWSVDAAGLWVSPSGRRWRESSQTVQRVQAQRVKLGLPAHPGQGRTGGLRGTGS